jgi:hypothetical protein
LTYPTRETWDGTIDPVARAIVIPFTAPADTVLCQQLALFFDQLLVYPIGDGPHVSDEERARIRAEIEFLVDRRVAARIGLQLPFVDPVYSYPDGRQERHSEMLRRTTEIQIPVMTFGNLLPKEGGTSPADESLAPFASKLSFNGAEVTALLREEELGTVGTVDTALQVTLGCVPSPRSGMPWEDIIGFRNATETRVLHEQFRSWMRRLVEAGVDGPAMIAELRDLSDRSRANAKRADLRYNEGMLGAVLSIPAAAASGDYLGLLSAVGSLVKARRTRLDRADAIATSPGREIGYLAHARSLSR